MESCSYPIIDRRKSKYSSVGRTKEKHLASSTGFSYPIMIGTPWYHSWYHPSITLRMFQLCHNVSIIIPSWLKTLISSQFLHLWLPTRAEPLRHDRHDRLPSPEAWRVKSCTTWDALNVKCCDIYLTAAQYVGSWNVGFLEQETSPSLWNGYFFGDGSKASHGDVILSSKNSCEWLFHVAGCLLWILMFTLILHCHFLTPLVNQWNVWTFDAGMSSKIPTVPIYILAMLKWYSSEKTCEFLMASENDPWIGSR